MNNKSFFIGRLILCCILLFSFNTDLFAQKFLSLEKLGKTNRKTYSIGEEIKYKTKDEEFERTDVISDLDYDGKLVIFKFDTVELSNFEYIRVEPRKGVFSPYTGLTIAAVGAAFFVIDWVNRSIVQGEDYTFDNNTAKTSLIIVGVGLLWYSFKRTKFKPGRNKRIRIADLSPG